ncbi:MAG: hypothetical protein QXO21_04765, partial [Candidatus Anstonellales archaeon]
ALEMEYTILVEKLIDSECKECEKHDTHEEKVQEESKEEITEKQDKQTAETVTETQDAQVDIKTETNPQKVKSSDSIDL